MLLGARVHAMLLYIVIYLLVFSVLIPLSAYVGRRTFHIYNYLVLPYVGQQPSTYMLGISSAWIFRLAHLTHEHFTNAFNIYIHCVFDMWVDHQFTRCLIPAYIGRRTCIYHIYSLGV